jgi:hypothetical protein
LILERIRLGAIRGVVSHRVNVRISMSSASVIFVHTAGVAQRTVMLGNGVTAPVRGP